MVIPALPSAIKIWSSPSVVRRRVSVSLISWLQANALLCASASATEGGAEAFAIGNRTALAGPAQDEPGRGKRHIPARLQGRGWFAVVCCVLMVCCFLTAPVHCTPSSTEEIALWPGTAPDEKAGAYPPEKHTPTDGQGCGAGHNEVCYHIYSVSRPSIKPFVVNNGTGSAVIIAPGGGYSKLSWSKEGLDVARMYNSLGVSAFVLKYRYQHWRKMMPYLLTQRVLLWHATGFQRGPQPKDSPNGGRLCRTPSGLWGWCGREPTSGGSTHRPSGSQDSRQAVT